MDEYVGLAPGHTASFPAFLQHHLLNHIPAPAAFHPVIAREGHLETDCADYANLLRAHPADFCAMGIGENGHIAFNDPPFAEFDDPVWVKVVQMDVVSRQQQVGEGHFGGLDEVPTHAITLTIPALLAAKRVLCIVPEARKANAVYDTLHGPITEACPASIMRQKPHVHLYLDAEAAAKAYPVMMNSRERLLTALDHREPDRIPFDLGSIQVSGIHEVAYRNLREALGLPETAVTLCDTIQQLATVEDDLAERLGIDTRGLYPLNSHNWGIVEEDAGETLGLS